MQCCFAGRRIVIFSGGPTSDTASFLESVQAIHRGGGFGSIVGRNSFQRPKAESIKFLRDIMDIYAS